MSKFPETQKTAVLSTAHLTIGDHDLLEIIVSGLQAAGGRQFPILIGDTEFGYMVYAQHGFAAEQLLESGFSAAFAKIMICAQDEDMVWVRFDCDGFTASDFQQFEWPDYNHANARLVEAHARKIVEAHADEDRVLEQRELKNLVYRVIPDSQVQLAELREGSRAVGIDILPVHAYHFLFPPKIDLDDVALIHEIASYADTR